MNSQNNYKKKRNTKAKGKKNLRQKSSNGMQETKVLVSRHLVIPNRAIVKLSYLAYGQLSSAGFGNSASWNCNGAFDFDPVLGSPGLLGLQEWMAFYAKYRVLSCRARGRVSSIEGTNPLQVAHGYFPAVIAAGAFTPTRYRNTHCRNTIVGCRTANADYNFDHYLRMDHLFDKEAYHGDESYRGTASSNPAILGSFCLSTYTVTGGVLTNGIGYKIDFDIEVELTEPKFLQS